MAYVTRRVEVWIDCGAVAVCAGLGLAGAGLVLWPHLLRWWAGLALLVIAAMVVAFVAVLVSGRVGR